MRENKKTNIVIIGDSNTEGFGLNSPEQSYPYKLKKLLGENVLVYNMGITGTCVINTKHKGKQVGMPYVNQKAYKNALAIEGDIFIINLGTNDAQDGIDDILPKVDEYSNLIKHKKLFLGDYIKIIEDIKKYHPNAKIFICIPIPVRKCIWRKHQEKYLELIIPYFQNILNRYNEMICINLHTEFLKLKDIEIDSMYLEDGLHLNDKGTTYVAEKIMQYIKRK